MTSVTSVMEFGYYYAPTRHQMYARGNDAGHSN